MFPLKTSLKRCIGGLPYNTPKRSHIRVTTQLGGEHHEVIPNHSPIRIGTQHSILNVAEHHRMSIEELVRMLELK